MSSYKTKAIIIKRRNQGESDRVLTLFSFDRGLVGSIAKGARKQKSKFGGSLELFNECELILNQGKTFEIITEAMPTNHYISDQSDLGIISDAHFFSELTIKALIENHPAPELYNSLSFCLDNLGKYNHRLLRVYYISKVLKFLGTYPELSICLACQKKPIGNVRFSNSAGGIFCDRCRPITEGLFAIDRDTVKLWRYILSTDPTGLLKLNISNVQSDILATTVENFLEFTTGREYLSLDGIKLTD